jgi:excisionase family DNA binding protein
MALLTATQVAALFQITPKTARAWARLGLLPTVRRKGGYLFVGDELGTWRAQVTGALDVDAAAGMIGVSRETLYRWMRSGRVRFLRRPGGRRLLEEAEIQRLRAAQGP